MRKLHWLLWGSLMLGAPAAAQSAPPAPVVAPSMPEAQPTREVKVATRRAALLPGAVRLAMAPMPDESAGLRAPEPQQPVGSAPGGRPRIALGVVNDSAHASTNGRLRVIGGAGSLWTSFGASVVEVPARGVAVIGSSDARQLAAKSLLSTKEKTPLPWMVLDDDPDAAPGEPVVRATRPFLQLAEAIRWDAARKLHVASFWFGLDVERGTPGPLPRPIDVLFSVSCGELAPRDKLRIEATGIAGYARITVGCSPSDKRAQDPQQLTLRLDQGQLEYPFAIPRRPGAPQLLASTLAAEGLGLSTIELTVDHREEDGTLLPVPEDLTVGLTTESGELDVTELMIPKGAASARLRVRPRGIGPLRISAVAGGLASAPVAVDLGFPTLAVLAALIGGGLGGGLAARKKRRHRMPARIAEGALVGLVVAALSLVLPSFSALGGALGTEVALFALSAIAGFVGSHLIESAASVLFPSLKRPQQEGVAE